MVMDDLIWVNTCKWLERHNKDQEAMEVMVVNACVDQVNSVTVTMVQAWAAANHATNLENQEIVEMMAFQILVEWTAK